MQLEGNIFYCVMPSCIAFYLAVSGFSSYITQVEAGLEFCQIQGAQMFYSLFSTVPHLKVTGLDKIFDQII